MNDCDDMSERLLYFETKAAESERYGTIKKDEKRIFVTSRYISGEELTPLIEDFKMFQTVASGEWGRVTEGVLESGWEPRIRVFGGVCAHRAMLFIARKDTKIEKIIRVLRGRVK